MVLIYLRNTIALGCIGHDCEQFFGVTGLAGDLVMAEDDRTALAFWACCGDIIVKHFQALPCFVINNDEMLGRVWPFNQFRHIKFAGPDQGFCVNPAMVAAARRMGIFHLGLVLLREACDWIITFDQVSVIMYHLANLCFYPSIFHAMNVPFVAPQPKKKS